MTWFKVDDSFHSHPKVLAATPAALGLWVVAGSWSGANLSDGFVPDHVLPRLLPDPDALAKELVTCRLWRRAKGGYQFHDWIDYQPSKQEALAGKAKKSIGGALGNHRRWHVDTGKSDPQCRYCHPSDSDTEGGRQGDRSTTPEGYENRSHGTPRQPVDNSPAGRSNHTDQEEQHRTTDRTTDRSPIGTPNRYEIPRPDPTRPDPKGGTGPSVTTDRAHADSQPPSTCEEHKGNPNPPPCGKCADARRARAHWEADRRRRLDEAPRCRTHRGQPAHNCAPCRSERLAGGDAA